MVGTDDCLIREECYAQSVLVKRYTLLALNGWSLCCIVPLHRLLTQDACAVAVFCADALVRLLVAVLPAADLMPPHCPILLGAYQGTLSTTGEQELCSHQCLCVKCM